MDSIESNIRLILDGKTVDEGQEFCDFSLEAQNQVTGMLLII